MNSLEADRQILSSVFNIDLQAEQIFWVGHKWTNTADQKNNLKLNKLALLMDFVSLENFWLALDKTANTS